MNRTTDKPPLFISVDDLLECPSIKKCTPNDLSEEISLIKEPSIKEHMLINASVLLKDDNP
jgi:hypothetical protein